MARSTAISRYDAGTTSVVQQYVTTLSINGASMDEAQGEMFCRFIEFWCQKNCQDAWRLELIDYRITVSFASIRDASLFKISNEYAHFEDRWKAILSSAAIINFLIN